MYLTQHYATGVVYILARFRRMYPYKPIYYMDMTTIRARADERHNWQLIRRIGQRVERKFNERNRHGY